MPFCVDAALQKENCSHSPTPVHIFRCGIFSPIGNRRQTSYFASLVNKGVSKWTKYMFAHDLQYESFIFTHFSKHTFGRNGSLKVGVFPFYETYFCSSFLAYTCRCILNLLTVLWEVEIGTRCFFWLFRVGGTGGIGIIHTCGKALSFATDQVFHTRTPQNYIPMFLSRRARVWNLRRSKDVTIFFGVVVQ